MDRNMRSLHLDNFWMEVLLLLIGEAFGEHHGQLVNGAVVNIRGKGDKIAIWMSRQVVPQVLIRHTYISFIDFSRLWNKQSL